MRYLTGSIKDWYRLFEQAARCTKPGGWVESYESAPYLTSDDDTIAPGSAIAQWGKFFIDGGKITGRSFLVCDDGTQRAAMEKAGLVDIQERSYKVSLAFLQYRRFGCGRLMENLGSLGCMAQGPKNEADGALCERGCPY